MATNEFPPIVSFDRTATITIATSTTVSEAVDLSGCALVGIFVPTNFDGTQFKFQVCSTLGGTYVSLQDGDGSSSAFTVTTAASRYVPLDNLAILAGVRFLKIETLTAQADTDTVFTLATRPL